MIRAAGSNGTADITWAEDTKMTRGRSKDGKLFGGITRRFKKTVTLMSSIAGASNDRRSCIGPMTVGRSEDVHESFS